MEKMSDCVQGKQSYGYEDTMNVERKQLCEPCSEEGKTLLAVGFCVDCQHYLCDLCYKCHCIPKPMKNHTLLNKEKMPRKKVSEDLSEICTKHDGERIKYFCRTHDVVGCNSCMLLDHKPCQGLCTLSEKARDVELSKPYKELRENLSDIEEKCKQQLEAANINSTASQTFYQEAIDKTEELQRAVNAHFDALKEEIKKNAMSRRNRDTTDMEQLVANIKSIQTEQTRIKEDLKILEETQQNKQLFIALTKSKNQVERFKRALSKISNNNNVTRYVFKETSEIRAFLGNVSSIGNLYELNEDQSSDKNPYLSEYAEYGIVKRTSLFENCSVRIFPIEKRIEVFENEETISATLISNPWDLCSTDKHGEFVLTLPYDRKIKVYSYFGKEIIEQREMKVHFQCEGIDYGDNNLFIASPDPAQVTILSLKGDIQRIISNDPNTGTALFRKPAYVHYSSRTKCMYVTDRDSEEVLLLTLDGKPLKVHKRNENKQSLWALHTVYCVLSLKI